MAIYGYAGQEFAASYNGDPNAECRKEDVKCTAAYKKRKWKENIIVIVVTLAVLAYYFASLCLVFKL